MSKTAILFLTPILLFLLSANGNEKPRLTFHGLGDIHIGMSSDDARKLGFRLTTSGPWDEIGDDYFVSCHYLDSAPGFPGIALMMSEDKVVRIDIGYEGDEGWQSYSGARVGSSQTAVKTIYGDWLKISHHPYLGKSGSYLRLDSADGKYAMIFETAVKDMSGEDAEDEQKEKFVTNFRSGYADPVSYIEGCA